MKPEGVPVVIAAGLAIAFAVGCSSSQSDLNSVTTPLPTALSAEAATTASPTEAAPTPTNPALPVSTPVSLLSDGVDYGCPYNVYRTGLIVRYPDTSYVLDFALHPDSEYMYTFWDSEDYRSLIDQAAAASDPDLYRNNLTDGISATGTKFAIGHVESLGFSIDKAITDVKIEGVLDGARSLLIEAAEKINKNVSKEII